MVLLTNNRHLNLYALYSNGVTSPSLQSVKICYNQNLGRHISSQCHEQSDQWIALTGKLSA